MAKPKAPSLGRQALYETRRGSDWQRRGVILGAILSVLSIGIGIGVYVRDQIKAQPKLSVAICASHIFKTSDGIVSTCVSPASGMEEGVRFEFTNTSSSGVTINSASLDCLKPSPCFMHDIGTADGDKSGFGSLPVYLSAGQADFFLVPIGCSHEILDAASATEEKLQGSLKLSTGKVINSNSLLLKIPTAAAAAECKLRRGGSE